MKILNQFNRGDKVRLRVVNARHGRLRYHIPDSAVGTVTYCDADDNWMFVDWGLNEAAMRMWPEELEAVIE